MTANHLAPTFVVRLLGTATDPTSYDLRDRVLDYEYTDSTDEVDKLSLTLDNWDLSVLDDERWRFGGLLESAWGYHGDLNDPRQFQIRSVGGTLLQPKITAIGPLIKMHGAKESGHWDNMTRSQVVAEIAKKYGFDNPVIEDTGVKHDRIVKPSSMTDAQFIKSLAAKEGCKFFVDKGGTMHFHRAKWDQAPVRELVFRGIDVDSDILDVGIDYDAKSKVGKRTLEGRDPLTKKPIKVEASNAETKRDGLGATIDSESYNEWGELTLRSTVARAVKAPTTETTAAAAKRQADGQYIAQTRPEIKLRVTIIGDPRLAAHQVVMMSGIGRRLSGRYAVKGTSHKIGTSGYTTALQLERDGHNGFGSTKDPKNEATINKQPVKKPDALEQAEQVDEATGQIRIIWKKP